MKVNDVTKGVIVGIAAAGLLLLQGCGQNDSPGDSGDTKAKPDDAMAASPGQVVQIRAVGKTFEGPGEVPSGWTTFQFVNASSMVHFAMIDVPPEGVTAKEFTFTAGQYFQEAMDGMNAGDQAAVEAAFAKFPDWIGQLGRNGGPGLLSPGRTSQTTVYLEPGRYFLECYVKSDGIFHTTSPGGGKLGMMLEFNVANDGNGAAEPSYNVTVEVRNSGLAIVDGALTAGTNTIRVDFVEQQALPSFVANDVHLMAVDGSDSIRLANAWMDWQAKEGLEDPSPVTFLGGINDMPAGSHGYFTVDLPPGDYAFISEMPDPAASGFVLPFSVDTAT